ncbi:unnamed protein product [Cladocopium goreaui]|uniref:Uncharacterized protein n=1 Tax=Cladocopium goreaui TaxID=2562237 RepID=A0A9P1FJU9_9DINO|nr:unnamed protein product [Cladocopium goreaui]
MFCFLFLSQCLPQVHVLTLQFVAARKATAGALVVWADLTKFGRLGVSDLNFVVSIIHKALSKVPTKGVAILIAPHLVSEKVSGGQRGDVRRIEDKLDSRQLLNQLITIRMECPPASKKVPLQMLGWIVMLEGAVEENIFKGSQLMTDRSTRQAVPWASESSYIVPAAEKDSLPHASEGQRSLSDVQESAQLLAGSDFPNAVLTSVLGKLTATAGMLVNVTPYDGCLETCLMKWHEDNGMMIDYLSVSRSVGIIEYVEKKIGFHLLQGWKAGNHCMGDVRPYQPEPPAAREEDNVDPKDYEFKLVVCEVNNTKKGWERYKFTLPSHVRSMYARDIVYGADWRALLQEFDERFGANSSATSGLAPPPAPVAHQAVQEVNWPNEPSTIDNVMEIYHVEAKATGRLPGTTLLLVAAKNRAGKTEHCCPGQLYKLFLVAHMEVEIPADEYVICHGTSRFINTQRMADLKRKEKTDELARVVACKWHSDTEKVVLEISDPTKKKTTDAQVCSWRELFSDLEDEGHFEVTVNSHDVQKAPASSEDTSEFYIRPKANEMFYSWGSVATNGIKFGSMASAFTGRERERDEQQLRASASVAADDTESAVATWDAYGPCNSDCDMAVVPGEGSIAEEPKPDGLVPGEGCITEEPKPDGSLCAMCLFAAMQKGKESTNMQVKKALTKSQQRYLETGYKELEKLTHENYEQCP